MHRVLIVTFVIFALGLSYARMQDDPGPAIVLPDTETVLLTATGSGQEYQLSIGLPKSYDTSEDGYPVLYVLDGNWLFVTANDFVHWLAPAEMPELIVVGIGYPTDQTSEILRRREQDYGSRSLDFRAFMTEDMMPYVEANFRTTSDRALAGYSLSADYVLNVFAQEPERFNRYIVISSANAVALFEIINGDDAAFRAHLAGLDVKLFSSFEGSELIGTTLQAKAYAGLEVTSLSLDNATHLAALHLSLPAGLLAVYD